ncbi:MAG: sigma-70 family RNA polymerase sigma factor [Acidobacteria bacterium]|nr:sigma-70 family RNA polymerase sigma factor [Acidobacteriota bacterium]
MFKGTQLISGRKLHEKVLSLRKAGRNEREIAEQLGLTLSTIKYIASLFLTEAQTAFHSRIRQDDQRLKLAYEMRQAGKSYAEIQQLLQISTARVRQMVHRYTWALRQS